MYGATPTADAIATLEAELALERAAHGAQKERADTLEKERNLLRASLERLQLELKLLKLRLFVAKAERVDTTQLEVEFKDKLKAVEELAGTTHLPQEEDADGDEPGGAAKRRKSTGRRNLRTLPLEERRVEFDD